MRKKVKDNYKLTIYACFAGYIVQAIVNNFVPLLFLTFQSAYDIPLSKITFLVTFNFGIQLLIDAVSPFFIDKIGYRMSVILAHVFSATGLLLLTLLPEICADPFTGLLIAVMIYALGGGLLEVLISPIVEACPTDNKETAMSMLHSFYCWGTVGVVLLSTLFFAVFEAVILYKCGDLLPQRQRQFVIEIGYTAPAVGGDLQQRHVVTGKRRAHDEAAFYQFVQNLFAVKVSDPVVFGTTN